MKIVKVLLPVAFLFCLVGCVEINEDIDIKKDGSGEYSMNMDMSKLLDMMQNTIGKDELEKQMPEKKMDTSIMMKTLVDTSTSIPADKKALLRQGHLHMSLNMDQNLFKTDLHFPFKNENQLQQLYTSIGDGSLGTGQMLKNLSPGKNDSSENPQGSGPDFGQFNSIYTFTSRSGYLSRAVNKEKFNALKESAQYGQMKQMGDMGMEVPYTITIHLPKPAKKIINTFAKLSDDKKTVTIKYNLTEVMEHPEKFEYTIEY